MRKKSIRRVAAPYSVALLLLACLSHSAAQTHSAAPMVNEPWPFEIETSHRPGTYLWVPGSAWDEANIQFTVQKYHQAGFGTLHVIPIYGAQDTEDRTVEFLSPKWMGLLDSMVREARPLGMQVDMTTGTGWCFGGPGLNQQSADLLASCELNEGGDAAKGLTFSTLRMVKRAAPGGEGNMLNPYSPAAMRFYLQRFSRAFDEAQPALPRAQYHDSFEYHANWSAELLDVFRQRHGYDLTDHLAALFGSEDEKKRHGEDLSSRVLVDYRSLLSELHVQTMQVWSDWSRARGMLTRNEAHGSPSNLIDTYSVCDIPETEMYGSPDYPITRFRRDPLMSRKTHDATPLVCRFASSAAHIAHEPGRQLVSSESCTWLREHWHASLAHVKLQIDDLFIIGVNHLFFHGSCYSPKEVPWPGWFFYASTKFDWRNAFWRDLPTLNTYIARCQSVLQAGQPDNDLLLYWPVHDVWRRPQGNVWKQPKNPLLMFTVHRVDWLTGQSLGPLATMLNKQGYAFDFISDRLLQEIKFFDGKLHAPGGTYRAIVVPQCDTIPAATLGQIAALAEQGATVIFQKQIPEDVPGWGRLETRRKQFAAVREKLLQADPIVATDLLAALQQSEIPRESMSDSGLEWIRRRVGDETYYFLANQTAESYDDWLTPSRPMTAATLLDPMTGESGKLTVRNREGQSQVYMQLAPGESRILRIGPARVAGEPWPLLVPKGNPLLVEQPWHVEFIEGGPTLPESYSIDRLVCWTEAPDPEAQCFAGTACYKTTMTLPTDTQADDWLLDLGEVRESARVRINGQDAGAVVALPTHLRVGKYLRPGENSIEVEVTNLSANRIRDLDRRGVEWKIMQNSNIASNRGGQLEAANWPLEPSGLIGPVRLVPLAIWVP